MRTKKLSGLIGMLLIFSLASCGSESFNEVASENKADEFAKLKESYNQQRTYYSVCAKEEGKTILVDTKEEKSAYSYQAGVEYDEGFHIYESFYYTDRNYYEVSAEYSKDTQTWTSYFKGELYVSSGATYMYKKTDLKFDSFLSSFSEPVKTWNNDEGRGAYFKNGFIYPDFDVIGAGDYSLYASNKGNTMVSVSKTDLIKQYFFDKDGNFSKFYQEEEYADPKTNYTYETITEIPIYFNGSVGRILNEEGFSQGNKDDLACAKIIINYLSNLTYLR